MKLTLSWLKDHLETDADLETLTTALTSLGLEVDAVVDRSEVLRPFLIASVLDATPHPDADRLKVCQVDTGSETVQVVCGAPNARAGMKGVFAPAGTYIPGTGMTLKAGVIRGQASNGMLCSERELTLSDEHTGIVDLPPDAPVGDSFARFAGLDDPVIHIGLTPDRADCAGIAGIARDLAAAGLGTVKPRDTTPVPAAFKTGIQISRAFPPDFGDACPLFIGREIRGVTNGPSPKWLQDRLIAIGLRPISALVDITNFFTFDTARPLHVFDAGKIRGSLRLAPTQPGQTLAALNDKTYTMPDDQIIGIHDDTGLISLAGIVGGASTGVGAETRSVYLEVALFDPLRTAMTGRTLGIESDARYRFERGLDPEAAWPLMEAATRMILDLCGGEASEPVSAGAAPDRRQTHPLRHTRVRDLGGLDVPAEEQRAILERLGFTVEAGDGAFQVTRPSWRGDVHGEADLVEEVLRIKGFDAIPATSMPRPGAVPPPALTRPQRQRGQVRRALAARGLEEAVTFSFIAASDAAAFGDAGADLRLVNPIASDLDQMRPTSLPSLIRAGGRSHDRGHPNAALFELAPHYRTTTPDGQELVAAGIRQGMTGPRHWSAPPRPVDLFDAKGDAIAALDAAGAPSANLQATRDASGYYHPGRSGVLRLGPKVMAQFGELHPEVLTQLDVAGPVVGFEVFVERIPAPKKKQGTAKPLLKLAPLQPIERDFAFVTAADTPADKLVRAAAGADKALIRDVRVFDIYQGAGIGDGQKSVALQVTLQPVDTTPTDEDLEAVAKKVVDAVHKQTGATLRV